MSASTATMESANRTAASAAQSDRIHVPTSWRIGQVVVTGLILLLAAYYNLKGWQNPAGESPLPPRPQAEWLFDQVGFLILIGLVWLTTPTAGVIAMTTFQEAVRRRWMTALLAFALVMLALSTFFTWMQPGEEEKFLRDFGTGFILIITLLMAIFLGASLVPPEIERRTIFTILSKPVNRLEFIIGKFLGLALTLFLNLLFMSLMFLASYVYFKARREGWNGAMAVDLNAGHMGLVFDTANLGRALMLSYGQLIIMAALSLTLSLIVSNITAIVFCFIAYFGGQTSSYWEHLSGGGSDQAHPAEHLRGPAAGVVKALYFMLPRLDRFDVRERLVTDLPVGLNYMWKAFGSGLIYVAVMLTIAYLIFSDREF